MSLHAGQTKEVIARTNNYSKSDSGKGSSIELFYFDDNFCRIVLWVSAFSLVKTSGMSNLQPTRHNLN